MIGVAEVYVAGMAVWLVKQMIPKSRKTFSKEDRLRHGERQKQRHDDRVRSLCERFIAEGRPIPPKLRIEYEALK